MPNDSPLSPTDSMLQYDSLAAWARSVFSSKPHLHAAHWMISSVVPVKLPVTRGHSGAEAEPGVSLYGLLFGPYLGLPAADGGGALRVVGKRRGVAVPAEVAAGSRGRCGRCRLGRALLWRALRDEEGHRREGEVALADGAGGATGATGQGAQSRRHLHYRIVTDRLRRVARTPCPPAWDRRGSGWPNLGRRRDLVGTGAARVHAAGLVGHLRVHRRPRRVGDARGRGRRGSGRRAARSTAGRRPCRPTGRRRAASRSGTVASVSSSGWIVGSSSQRNGVDTWAPTRARTHHAPNTVLCGAFWLKSMKMRAPRCSFHHCPVMQVGPPPLHLAGDADRGLAGAVGVPARLDADVEVEAAVAGGLRERRDADLARGSAAPRPPPPGPSRSWCPATGRGRCAARRCRRGRLARYGHGWKPRQPWLAAHRTWARSAITMARDSVPLTVATVVVSSQSGALSGIRFWKKFWPGHAVRATAAAASAGRARCPSGRRRRPRSSWRGRAWSRRAPGT